MRPDMPIETGGCGGAGKAPRASTGRGPAPLLT
jgi:hypothetical protein